jgi:hypothetical protein
MLREAGEIAQQHLQIEGSALKPVSKVGIEDWLGNFTGISYANYQKDIDFL